MKKRNPIIVLLFLVSLTLSGQNSTMTIREVFDFQPGDIFHFNKCYVHMTGYFGAIRFEVMSKTTSPGNDTICYTLKHSDYKGHISGYTYYNYTKKECYTNLDSLVHTLIDTVGMITTPMLFNDWTYQDPALCDSLCYKYEAFYGFLFEPRHIWQIFGKGLGITDYYNDYSAAWPIEHDHWNMVYFKKGPNPCGTPDTTSTGIPQPEDFTGSIRTFPNPATSHITVEFDATTISHEKDLTMVDAFGREAMQMRIPRGTETFTLNINHLPAGIYLLRVSGRGKAPVTQRIIKTR